ncbi:N-acetylneuraminate synthase [Metabacillus sp. FJAT-52054]|uniref:N-acetylneuraminate synthase n=1 Tax=Metabacillus sediminis TaxID=3117746 RepID=A0ABZ2NH65_9BACI
MIKQTTIIAEAGVNHNGSLKMAFQLVDAAAEAGADAIKFQTFQADQLVTKEAKQAAYQEKNMGETMSQYEMLKKLELSNDEFVQIQNYCQKRSITFLSTPFDLKSVDFLIQTLGLETIKIPSGELSNAPYLYRIASYNVKIILSTGMATMEEIHHALAFISYGLAKKAPVTLDSVNSFYKTKEAKMLLQEYVTILHCTTEYPTPIKDINLASIDYLRSETGLQAGLSDHSAGIIVPIAAVARGAVLIEKHFTLNKQLSGPDHKASLEPCELKEMIQSIRQVEIAIGTLGKNPSQIELENKKVARKSLVACKLINEGEEFTADNITVKRPGSGISPTLYWDYVGKKATKDYKEDELI